MALCINAILLKALLTTFDMRGSLVFGVAETIERRGSEKIRAKGMYGDGVRSSKEHVVKASGLRWVSRMWLSRIPFAKRGWALPFLTALAPSQRDYQEQGRPTQQITAWARQLVFPVRRWLPERG
jgi:hypothetical protein